MIRIVLTILALLSPFWFPYPYTLFLSLVASTFFVPAGLLVGFLTELLYGPALFSAIPTATLLGAGISVIGFFVHRFIEARIISKV